MAESLKKWFPFLKKEQSVEELSPEEIVLQAKAMLEEAARVSDPAEKERIHARFWKSQRMGRESTEEAKRRIFLNWPKAEGELRSIQMANLDLLRRLKKICDEKNLSFFLLWGTLLGSVRHHGFIPWDDDIDVGMTLKEYTRLQQTLENHPVLRVDMYYNWDYGTVCPKLKFRDCEAFWVDIFLFEEFEITRHNKMQRWDQVRKKAEALQQERLRIIQRYYPPDSPCVMPIRNARIDAEIAEISSHWREGLDFYGSEGNALTESLEINPVFIRNIFLKEDIYPLRRNEMIFEGDRYSALRNAEAYLRAMYGNYMDLPGTLETRHSPEVENFLAEDLEKLKKIQEG